MRWKPGGRSFTNLHYQHQHAVSTYAFHVCIVFILFVRREGHPLQSSSGYARVGCRVQLRCCQQVWSVLTLSFTQAQAQCSVSQRCVTALKLSAGTCA